MKLSRYQSFLAIILFCVSLTAGSCSDAFRADEEGGGGKTEGSSTITGQVVNQADSKPIEAAFVEITSPAQLQQSTTTDSTGTYRFSINASQALQLTIQASKSDFKTTSQQLTVTPGSDFPNTDIALIATSDSGGGGDGGVKGEPAGAAAIVLVNSPTQAINIAETGDQVSSPFTFQVQDSAGRPLNTEKSVTVQFNLVSSPGGGEDVVPDTATTDASGTATTTLFSGNKAGEVKVQALVERPEVGLTIKSSPILIAIQGGFPDKDHFSVAPAKHNFEGYSLNNQRDQISVVLGDKFSNPVKPGTIVYFESTGGVIQGSGSTDEDGIVEVDLISGDPRPSDGHATVTASTVNENNVRIQKTLDVIFSTSQATISANPTTFNLCSKSNASFSYTVTDLNGNPMPAGTKISVDGGSGIEVTGDGSITLGDFLQPGPGRTEFNFSIRDTDQESNEEADLTINISVTTPSGNTTTYSSIQGTRCKTAR